MNPSHIRLLSVVPVFLLTAAAAALAVGSPSGYVLLGVVVMALPLLALWRRPWVAVLFLPLGVAILAVALEWASGTSLMSGPAAELAAGLLIGSPLVFIALVGPLGASFGVTYLALSEGLAQSLVLLAAAAAIGTAAGAGAFVRGYSNVLVEQVNGVASIIHGNGVPSLPLLTAGGAPFYALAVVAFLGCLLGALYPEEAAPRPVPPEAAPRLPRLQFSPRNDLGLPPPVRTALAGRTPASGRPAPLLLTLTPVAIGAFTVAGFLAIAAAAPTEAVTVLGVGASVLLVGLILLGRGRRMPPVQGGDPGPLERL